MRRRRFLQIALPALAMLLARAPASETAPMLIGTLGESENCIPFGCPTTLVDSGTYQQVYSNSLFGEPGEVSSITFFDTFDAFLPDFDALASGAYTFSFSTTSAPVGGLSTILGNNAGSDSQVFFAGPLGGPLGGPSFTLSGTPFFYDPALGNLLLQVNFAASGGESFTFFDSNEENRLFSRAYSFAGGLADSRGLVTQFDFQPIQPIPEPSTLILIGSGLLGACARRWRTRSTTGR